MVMAARLCEETKRLRCTPYRVIALYVNFILVKLLSKGRLSVWSPGELGGALGTWELEPSIQVTGTCPSLCKTSRWLPEGSHSSRE